MHIHVYCADGEAKFWLTPTVSLAQNHGLSKKKSMNSSKSSRKEKMRLSTLGTSISEVEISNISDHGFWLYVMGKEYFLPYDQYPWFKNARISEIFDVQLLHHSHLYWQKLDVDLAISSLENPEKYPLIYK